MSRPVLHAHRHAVSRHHLGLTGIFYLLGTCRPSHVARFVMAIIIFAVDRVFGRGAAADICQELLKRVEPKFNAAFSVFVVILRSGASMATTAGILVSGKLRRTARLAV